MNLNTNVLLQFCCKALKLAELQLIRSKKMKINFLTNRLDLFTPFTHLSFPKEQKDLTELGHTGESNQCTIDQYNYTTHACYKVMGNLLTHTIYFSYFIFVLQYCTMYAFIQ